VRLHSGNLGPILGAGILYSIQACGSQSVHGDATSVLDLAGCVSTGSSENDRDRASVESEAWGSCNW